MKIDMTRILTGLDGKPLKEKETSVILKSVCTNALLGVKDGENKSGEEKYKQFKLAERINQEEQIELTSEEIVMIKNLIGQLYVPLVVGRAFDLLEGKDGKTKD